MKKMITGVILTVTFGSSYGAVLSDASVSIYDNLGELVNFDVSPSLVTGSIGGGVWSVSSMPSFLGSSSVMHDGVTFGPGTYSIDTIEGGIYNFTVGESQTGGHILWDWSANTDFDIINVWDVSTVAGVTSYTSTDIDLNGIAGIGLIDGTFASVPFSVNYNFSTVVPVPAAAWLFGSGLIAITGFSRRGSKSTIV